MRTRFRSLFIAISAYFARQEQEAREGHLAQATNLCDLEQRIRAEHRGGR
jgi:hypothetical protein